MTAQIANDFSRDVTDEIQALLDAPSRDVYLPGGTYKISRPLKICSNTRLSLAPDATVRLADGVCTSMLICATHEVFLDSTYLRRKGNQRSYPFTPPRSEISGVTENIVIRGGCWDSNNVNMPHYSLRQLTSALQLGVSAICC